MTPSQTRSVWGSRDQADRHADSKPLSQIGVFICRYQRLKQPMREEASPLGRYCSLQSCRRNRKSSMPAAKLINLFMTNSESHTKSSRTLRSFEAWHLKSGLRKRRFSAPSRLANVLEKFVYLVPRR